MTFEIVVFLDFIFPVVCVLSFMCLVDAVGDFRRRGSASFISPLDEEER